MSRHYRSYNVSHGVTFAPALVGAPGGWLYLHEPLHLAGLAVMTGLGLIIIPSAVLIVLFFLPAFLAGGLVPRRWRVSHRHRHGRKACKSAYITRALRRVVFAADRYTCVACGARWGIEATMMHPDHVRPWAGGGLTVLLNMMTLCEHCNLVKSNYWMDRDGYIHYHGYQGLRAGMALPPQVTEAAAILHAERVRRWNPLRLVRAAWALG